MKTIGEKLKSLREQSKLSQQQLSSYLQIDQTYLSKIESNERSVPTLLLDRLTVLYGIKLSDFDQDNITIKPINYSMRQKDINDMDLKAIADINTIASNLLEMTTLLEKTNEK